MQQLRDRDFSLATEQTDEPARPVLTDEPPSLPDPLSFSNRGAKLNFSFDILVVMCGWMLHPVWIVPGLLLALAALNVFVRYSGQLITDFHGFVDSRPLSLYLLAYVLPKLFVLSVLQSVLTGMVCRHFGGRVNRAWIHLRGGVIPLFRTRLDPSALAQTNWRGRVTLLSVGLWLPFVIGSGATVGWAATAPDSGLRILYVLMIPPCLIRIAINSNLFFRFSSLHMLLCEAIGERRLLHVASNETRAWLMQQPSPFDLTGTKRYWIRFFGISYLIYQFVSLLVLMLGGGYLLMTYADSHDLPPWSVAYAILIVTLLCSWNFGPRVKHERRLSWRLQPVARS